MTLKSTIRNKIRFYDKFIQFMIYRTIELIIVNYRNFWIMFTTRKKTPL